MCLLHSVCPQRDSIVCLLMFWSELCIFNVWLIVQCQTWYDTVTAWLPWKTCLPYFLFQQARCHPVVTFLCLYCSVCYFLFVCCPLLFAFCLAHAEAYCLCAAIHPLPHLMCRCPPEYERRSCDRMACPAGPLESCGAVAYGSDQEN